MKRIIIVIVFSVFIMLLSCDEKIVLVTCSDCVEEEPLVTNLEVKLDFYPGSLSSGVIRLYEGNIEDNVLIGTFSSTDPVWRYTVAVNTKYTLSVTYIVDGVTYIAVDSATPRVRYETKQCDSPCYFVYDKTVNLRLKYTK